MKKKKVRAKYNIQYDLWKSLNALYKRGIFKLYLTLQKMRNAVVALTAQLGPVNISEVGEMVLHCGTHEPLTLDLSPCLSRSFLQAKATFFIR